MEKTFKTLVLTSFLLFLTWWFLPYAEPYLAPDAETLSFWESTGFDARMLLPNWFYNLWLVFWIVAYAGLFMMHRSMRTIFLAGYVLSLIMAPFLGSVILSPWSSVVSNIGMLLDGAVLALAFFSSVAPRFNRVPSSISTEN